MQASPAIPLCIEGNKLFSAGKFSEAIKKYNEALKVDPSNATILCNRSASQLAVGINRRALQDASQALEQDPSCQKAVLLKVEALRALGKDEEARTFVSDHIASITDVHLFKQLQLLITTTDSTSSSECNDNNPFAIQQMKSTTTTTTSTSTSESAATSTPTPKKVASSPPPPPPSTATAAHQQQQQPNATTNSNSITNNNKVASVPPATAVDADDHSTTLSQQLLLAATSKTLQNGVGDVHVDQQIALGYLYVNTGKFEQALQLFTKLLAQFPTLLAGYLARGTAYALSGHLDLAIADFTRATEIAPNNQDAWKRRGQARAAAGMALEALEDMARSVELNPKDPDAYYQRGALLHKLHDYESAAKDFKTTTELQPNNSVAWNYYGVCLNALGDCMLAVKAYERATHIDPSFKEAWTNMAQAYKDWGMYPQAEAYFSKAISMDSGYFHAYHLRAIARYGVGDLKGALRDATKGKSLNPKNKDICFWRGLCLHNMGQLRLAVEEYSELLARDPKNSCWYNREVALFVHHHLDVPLSTINLDMQFDPKFKEACCKRMDPSKLLSSTYVLQLPINESIPDVDQQGQDPRHRTAEIDLLLTKTAPIGARLQLDSPGYVTNKRQHRMCAFAVVEMAQALRAHIRNGVDTIVDGKSSSLTNKPHKFGWRDFFDIGVKWRQLSEPNDPVWWVDRLPLESFEEGFGLQTPMYSGQMKVPRYYPYCQMALEQTKSLIMEQWALTDETRAAIQAATTLQEVHKLMGRDFWVVTQVESMKRRGTYLDGARLTIVKQKGIENYEFSMRIPGVPSRWAQYDEEMTDLFDRFVEEARKGPEKRDLDKLSDIILRIHFYFTIFAPLTRGVAALGLIAIMAMFYSIDIEVSSVVRKNKQLDFESIMGSDIDKFVEYVRGWLYPLRSPTTLMEELPLVSEVVDTPRKLIAVLNAALPSSSSSPPSS